MDYSLREVMKENDALKRMKLERDLRRENESLRRELGIKDPPVDDSAEQDVARRFGINIIKVRE